MRTDLTTGRLLIKIPGVGDAARLAAYVTRNRDHFATWAQKRPDSYYTEAHWDERLPAYLEELTRGNAARFMVIARAQPEGPMIGEANLFHIIRGGFQACYLSYSLDREQTGRGLMTEALSAVLDYAFDDLGLHRVMANYMPTNERSGRLLRRLGFQVEGYARDYLKIADKWEDHIMTALTNPRNELSSTKRR